MIHVNIEIPAIKESYVDYYRVNNMTCYINKYYPSIPEFELKIENKVLTIKYCSDEGLYKLKIPFGKLDRMCDSGYYSLRATLDVLSNGWSHNSPGDNKRSKIFRRNLLQVVWISQLYCLSSNTAKIYLTDYNDFMADLITPDMGIVHDFAEKSRPSGEFYYEIDCDNAYNFNMITRGLNGKRTNTANIIIHEIYDEKLEDQDIRDFDETDIDSYMLNESQVTHLNCFPRSSDRYKLLVRIINKIINSEIKCLDDMYSTSKKVETKSSQTAIPDISL